MPRRLAIVVLALNAVGALLFVVSRVPAMATVFAGDLPGVERLFTVVLPFLLAVSAALWCPAAAALTFAGSASLGRRVSVVSLRVLARAAVVAAALSFLWYDLPWAGAAAVLIFVVNTATVHAIRREETSGRTRTPQKVAVEGGWSSAA